MWSRFETFSRFWGARRRFLRRLSGLGLLLLGVHLAAEKFDALAFFLIDCIDLWVDGWASSAFAWSVEQNMMSAEEAVHATQVFAETVDLGSKDRASKWCALLLEWGFALWLFDFAWGSRTAPEPLQSSRERFVQSAWELKALLWPPDLERLALAPVLLGLSCAGALDAALAIETFAADRLTQWSPAWRQGAAWAAILGLIAAALLIWRVTPDLLDGALRRAQERGERSLEKRLQSGDSARWRTVRLRTRGWFFAAVALPFTWLGLQSQDAFVGLVSRIGGHL